jgi:phosphate transport system permease protein
MTGGLLILIFAVLVPAFFLAGYRRAAALIGDHGWLLSLPVHHGAYVSCYAAIPALFIAGLWALLDAPVINWLLSQEMSGQNRELSEGELSLVINQIKNLAASGKPTDDPLFIPLIQLYKDLQVASFWLQRGISLFVCLGLGLFALGRVSATFNARAEVEKLVQRLLWLCASIAIFTTLGIILSVLFEALRFFQSVSLFEFLFGLEWSPQIALRADQQGSSGSFGAVPLFAGTFLISIIAMIIAVPVGLMSAIYLSEYASARVRDVFKPLLEILAGIPTVVYGFFATLTVAPFIRRFGESLGMNVASESALAAGVVMGIMIIPFISSLSDDIINAVPQSLRDGSFGLGATQSETIRQVVIPAALPGIAGGILLGFSRAIGETMIVVMAAGLAANLTANPLESVTTVTVQIVTLLIGDQEFDSPKTLAAFALGLMLFLTTLVLNMLALRIVKKYREQYD